jgi:hypothetical protein
VVKFSLHDLRELELEGLNRADGALLAVGLALSETVDVQLSVGDVSDVVIFEVENALGVLDNCSSVRGDEELDGLRKAVIGHEGARLRTGHLATGGGWDEEGVVAATAKDRRLGFMASSRLSSREFDIYEIDLELLFGLDANEKGRTATSRDGFVRVMDALENKCERALVVEVNTIIRETLLRDTLGVPSRQP